ncbi:leucine-rich repeat-containing protein 70-like [Leptopilina boulardi]|uniref:leucine-rich repeat-containing protein 70-like n=1 Tax=Leptopilina boulardi TaxID=63433 RepID=UPI0021F57A5A|nr:leucine-rich repeat-containing protein 70-like [Leptopilina boulardi]
MKLFIICSFLLSAVLLSDAVCNRNTIKHNGEDVVVWFCVRSKDVVADVARAPKDVKVVVFAYSDIPVLKNDVMTPVANDLVVLSIVHCNMEDIEDDALKGMVNLKRLIVSHNKLKKVKAAWFKDAVNVKMIDIQDNMIEMVEDDVAEHWKNVEMLHMSGNKVKCMSVDFMNHMTKLNHVDMEMNPWHMRCFKEIMNWLKEKELIGEKGAKIIDSKMMVQTDVCVNEMKKDDKVDDVAVDKCVMEFVEKMMVDKVVDVVM